MDILTEVSNRMFSETFSSYQTQTSATSKWSITIVASSLKSAWCVVSIIMASYQVHTMQHLTKQLYNSAGTKYYQGPFLLWALVQATHKHQTYLRLEDPTGEWLPSPVSS